MTNSTLLLNASYEPLSIVSAHRAIALLMSEKAISLDNSPKEFRGANTSIFIPYVAILRKQVKKGSSSRSAKFSRRGVLVRDNFTCAYCGKYGDTIDHILPKSRGGKSTYDNCVTACTHCNHKKSDKTIKELGWSMPILPPAPNLYENFLVKARGDNTQYEVWEKYVSYYVPNRSHKITQEF